MGKTVTQSWDKLAANDQIDRRFVFIILFIFMKKITPGGLFRPCPRAIYIYMTIGF